MSISALGIFTLATLFAALSPGLNVFLVSSLGLKYGVRQGLQAAVGVFLANLAYAAISVVGLTALLVSSRLLFDIVQFAGAAYLIFIGANIIRSALKPRGGVQWQDVTIKMHPLLQGFLTHISNPKGILYWSALLPQFVPIDTSSQFSLMIGLGILASAIELIVLCLYAVGADRLRAIFAKAGVIRAIDLLAGTFLIVAGTLLGLKTSLDRH